MVIYDTYAHCFGCQAHLPIDQVLSGEEIQVYKKEPENVADSIAYIESLPLTQTRGLLLHKDKDYLYIVWPDREFYKRRRLDSKVEPKYIGPRGVKPPLLKLESSKEKLIIIEGELNLLTAQLTDLHRLFTLVSPGSASQLSKFIDYYLQYKDIYIIVDKDTAGVVHGLELKKTLLKHKKSPKLIPLDKDLNQILQDEGLNGVKRKLKEEMGL